MAVGVGVVRRSVVVNGTSEVVGVGISVDELSVVDVTDADGGDKGDEASEVDDDESDEVLLDEDDSSLESEDDVEVLDDDCDEVVLDREVVGDCVLEAVEDIVVLKLWRRAVDEDLSEWMSIVDSTTYVPTKFPKDSTVV